MDTCNLSDRLIQAIKNRRIPSTSTDDIQDVIDQGADDIQELIDQGAGVNKRHSDGTLPIYWACRNSDVYCVKLLLHNGARVDGSVLGVTSLHRLVESSHNAYTCTMKCIKLLLQHGAETNLCDSNNRKPLYCAIRNDSIECVKLLLQHGANINTQCIYTSNNRTLLYWAAYHNNIDCVKLLVQHGDDVNVCDSKNRTPLFWAVRHNTIECVKLLVQHGADVNVSDKDNETPLYWAVLNNNLEFVELLLQRGAKIDVLDYNHDTPLNLAACDCHLEIIKTLLEYNANVNNINLDGQTPLMQAARTVNEFNTERNMACLELLIQASGQFDLRDENSELTPDITPYYDDDGKRELSELLLPYCVHPRSLKELCRYQIRLSLHQQFLPDVLPSLNLPKVLERFVLLQ